MSRRPQAGPSKAERSWDDEIAKEMEQLLFAGVTTKDLAEHFEVSPKQIRIWRRKLGRRRVKGFEKRPEAFLAEADALYKTVIAKAMAEVENASSLMTAATKASLLKRATETMEARVRLRQAAGIINPQRPPTEKDPEDMTDEEIQKEIDAADKQITRLDPSRKVKKKAAP